MTILHRLRFTLYFLRHRTDPNYLAIMVLVHTTTRQLIHEVWRKEPQGNLSASPHRRNRRRLLEDLSKI